MNLSEQFGQFCLQNKLVVTTAESCTAGLIAATIAQTPGSSAWLDCGFVVYTPEAKNKLLGVSLQTINKHNITSTQVAQEMALGALECSSANISFAVTGVAGPSGGTTDIPVGTVCIAIAHKFYDSTHIFSEKLFFEGDRNSVREQVVEYILNKAMKIQWN